MAESKTLTGCRSCGCTDLETVLDLGATPLADRVQVAEILAVDLDPYRHRIALNRGSQAGVYQGQALVDAEGIVGQVSRVELTTDGGTAVLVGVPLEFPEINARDLLLNEKHFIGSIGVYWITGADFDPVSGDLYVCIGGLDDSGALYTVDTETAAATMVASTHRLMGLAFDEDGTPLPVQEIEEEAETEADAAQRIREADKRARARSSSFCNLSVTSDLCRGCLIADVLYAVVAPRVRDEVR